MVVCLLRLGLGKWVMSEFMFYRRDNNRNGMHWPLALATSLGDVNDEIF